MNFLESIGGLTLFFLTGYFLLRLLNKKSSKEEVDKRIIENNDNIKKFLFDINKAEREGKPRPHPHEIQKRIRTLINDPKERTDTLLKIEQRKVTNELLEYEREQQMKERRKFAYQYDKAIFQIFDTKNGLTKEDILDGIRRIYETDLGESRKIFDFLKDNYLIRKSLEPRLWEIDYVLTEAKHKIIDSDLTRNEWLIFNNKEIE